MIKTNKIKSFRGTFDFRLLHFFYKPISSIHIKGSHIEDSVQNKYIGTNKYRITHYETEVLIY